MQILSTLQKMDLESHQNRSNPSIWKFFLLLVFLIVPGISQACPPGMALIGEVATGFCIDKYEASLDGNSAISNPGVLPEVNINQIESSNACANSGKRLCTDAEWIRACKGPNNYIYPYGNSLISGYCNDKGTLSETGEYLECVTAEGVFDMVGNVNEWTQDPAGTFRGGFYSDISINGPGCNYRTTSYSAFSVDGRVGFRCCSDDTLVSSAPQLTCVGFESPLDKPVNVKHKNRVLPLKMELFDEYGVVITDLDIQKAPLVEVDFSGAAPTADSTDVYLPAGQGDDGNKFVYTGSNWQFNLQTKNFSGAGTYTIRAVSGDSGSYVISPMCEASFIINE